MAEFLHYSRRFESWRGSLIGLPPWARLIVAVFALPGLAMLGLSILAVIVSFSALLLLTVPVYRLLRAVVGTGSENATAPAEVYPGAGRKQVDAKVVESDAE